MKSASLPASRSQRWKDQAIHQLAWFHRWLGIATCVIFALWFASGAVLLFKPFPSLPQAAQMGLQRQVDLTSVVISPDSAIDAAGGMASALRLVQRGKGPAYVVDIGDKLVPVDARTGALLPFLTPDEARDIGSAALGKAGTTSAAFDYDQWIVHNRFDPLRPFYRLDANDDQHTQLYLSARTGEFVQRTTSTDRAWNWVGAVLHWAYFTPIRSSFKVWDRTVWTVSFVAMLVAIAGTVLGVLRMITAQRQHKPSLSFYRKRWMRWHHIFGLFVSFFMLTWILSGWLSMDHGRLFSRGQATPAQLANYRGTSLAPGLQSLTIPTVRALGIVSEVGFDIIAGEPQINARRPNGTTNLYRSDGRTLDQAALTNLVHRAVSQAWPNANVDAVTPVAPTDTYALAEGWPADTLKVTLAGVGQPAVYVDGKDGRLLTVMSESRAAYAWIYYALHTFNFPGLTTRPLLREILVMVTVFAGFLFSITGIVIGVQRLRRSI